MQLKLLVRFSSGTTLESTTGENDFSSVQEAQRAFYKIIDESKYVLVWDTPNGVILIRSKDISTLEITPADVTL